MKIISFIENPKIIKKILKYLNLWDEERDSQLRTARDPPYPAEIPDEIVYQANFDFTFCMIGSIGAMF